MSHTWPRAISGTRPGPPRPRPGGGSPQPQTPGPAPPASLPITKMIRKEVTFKGFAPSSRRPMLKEKKKKFSVSSTQEPKFLRIYVRELISF